MLIVWLFLACVLMKSFPDAILHSPGLISPCSGADHWLQLAGCYHPGHIRFECSIGFEGEIFHQHLKYCRGYKCREFFSRAWFSFTRKDSNANGTQISDSFIKKWKCNHDYPMQYTLLILNCWLINQPSFPFGFVFSIFWGIILLRC